MPHDWLSLSLGRQTLKLRRKPVSCRRPPPLLHACPCPQINRSLKKARKADRKKVRREVKRASLSPGKDAEGGGAYDFSRDFYAGGGGGELSDDDEL